MYCRNCGREIADQAVICVHCGVATTRSNPLSQQKSRLVYILLGLFLGGLGIHNFYAGYTNKAIAQLLITVFCWLFVWLLVPILGLIAVFIWVIVDIVTVTADVTGRPFIS